MSIFEVNESLKNVTLSLPETMKKDNVLEVSKILIDGIKNIKGHLTKLEILGPVKRLRDPSSEKGKVNEISFFTDLIEFGSEKVDELVIDSILREN
jgi:hypothetical protein